MRVREVDYKDVKSIMIYITKEEKTDKGVQMRIVSLRKKYKNVALFVSGGHDLKDVLTRMVRDRR